MLSARGPAAVAPASNAISARPESPARLKA